jgi:hypothetical protein
VATQIIRLRASARITRSYENLHVLEIEDHLDGAYARVGDDDTAFGAQAGEARLTEILHDAGFTRVRRAAETPFNLIIEARP